MQLPTPTDLILDQSGALPLEPVAPMVRSETHAAGQDAQSLSPPGLISLTYGPARGKRKPVCRHRRQPSRQRRVSQTLLQSAGLGQAFPSKRDRQRLGTPRLAVTGIDGLPEHPRAMYFCFDRSPHAPVHSL